MTMSISDLFTPAPSGVNSANASATPPDGSWFAQTLINAQTLQLQTTSWQSGGMMRTYFALSANAFAQEDGLIAVMAQGGFLDFAATGSVTYTAANGETVTVKVSPDPSIPGENPNGALTWLDLLASSVYDVSRVGAAAASGTQAIANDSANVYGPFAVGTYHVSNPSTGQTYSNAASLTIAAAVTKTVSAASNTSPIGITTSTAHGFTSGAIVKITGVTGNTAANGFWQILVTGTTTFSLIGSTGNGAYISGGTANLCTTGAFACDVTGPGGTAGVGTITSAVTTLSGVTVSNTGAFVGSDWEGNVALAARCRLRLQSISPNGPHGAYQYFALTSSSILAAQAIPVSLSSSITRAKVNASPTTGVVGVTIANAAGAVSGVSNLAVTGATNASPIVITSATHGLSTGNYVTITGVVGNTNANGTWIITVLTSTTFSLTGSAGNAAYASGGIIEGGDLGEVDSVIQGNCVPDGITATTSSATNQNVAIAATVTVPQSKVAEYTANVQTALALYFAALAIGGSETSSPGIIEYDVVLGVLFAAATVNGQPSYVKSINGFTLNGGTVDVAFTSANHVATLSPSPAITVLGV